jgi:plastocyanin
MKFKIFVSDTFNHRIQVFAKSPSTNQPPVAEDQVVKTKKNKAVQIVLSASDVDVDVGDTFTFSIVSQPSHGIITNFDESSGSLTYIPDKKFTGFDEFTFQATDSNGASSEIATVSIVISNKMVVEKPSIDLDQLLSFIFKLIKFQLHNDNDR